MPDLGLTLARGPILPVPPVAVHQGWEVSARRAQGPLRLADLSPLTKVVVHAAEDGAVGAALGVRSGRSGRDRHGTLCAGIAPGEWLLLAPPQRFDDLNKRLCAAEEELVTIVDVTHGLALVRLSGADAPRVLAKVCAVDFHNTETPDGAAFRSSVARLAAGVIRDDDPGPPGPVPSYLLHCERSTGQYLFDSLHDAGREFGIEVDGFSVDSLADRADHIDISDDEE